MQCESSKVVYIDVHLPVGVLCLNRVGLVNAVIEVNVPVTGAGGINVTVCVRILRHVSVRNRVWMDRWRRQWSLLHCMHVGNIVCC